MARFLIYVVAGLGFVYVLLVSIVYLFQHSLMYFPTHKNPAPSDLGLQEVVTEEIQTQDGETLVAWFSPPIGARPTVIFLHGNAGEISDRLNRLGAYRSRGIGALFVSWRGYGGSTGKPSEDGFYEDARTAYDWLISNGVSHDKIVVVGESLGTGPAVKLASERPVGALILGAPYSSAVEVAAERFQWIPVRVLMKDQFRSIEFVGGVQAPTLILHGKKDLVIPYRSGVALYDAVRAPKSFVSFEDKGHEVLFQPSLFSEEINFISEVFQIQS